MGPMSSMGPILSKLLTPPTAPPVSGGMPHRLDPIIVIPRLLLIRLDAANTKLWDQSRLVAFAVQVASNESMPTLVQWFEIFHLEVSALYIIEHVLYLGCSFHVHFKMDLGWRNYSTFRVM